MVPIMTVQKQYIVTIGFRAKAGKAPDLERELRNRVPISRTEAGILDYRLYRSRTDDHVFFLFSRYKSEKSFDIHLYQPYIFSMLAEFEALLADPARVETYEDILG
jgi:quinol monooxygenase YgiN